MAVSTYIVDGIMGTRVIELGGGRAIYLMMGHCLAWLDMTAYSAEFTFLSDILLRVEGTASDNSFSE